MTFEAESALRPRSTSSTLEPSTSVRIAAKLSALRPDRKKRLFSSIPTNGISFPPHASFQTSVNSQSHHLKARVPIQFQNLRSVLYRLCALKNLDGKCLKHKREAFMLSAHGTSIVLTPPHVFRTFHLGSPCMDECFKLHRVKMPPQRVLQRRADCLPQSSVRQDTHRSIRSPQAMP